MRAILSRLFGSREERRRAEALLEAITAEARRPAIYAEIGVPDTLDGRFDMMTLVAMLAFRELQAKGEARLAQRTTDMLFMAFDDAIRSLGVGDNGVPRRVKVMGKAYVGRIIAYDQALKAGDDAALSAALHRNVFRGEGDDQGLGRLTAWVKASVAALSAQSREALASGKLHLPAP